MIKLNIFTQSFNIYSAEERKVLANSFIRAAETQVQITISLLNRGLISVETYSFEKTQSSGLTNLVGLYLIVNTRTKKIYLGGTNNLAQRKGEYNQSFTNSTRQKKLSKSMQKDLAEGGFKDFCFIPIVGILQKNLTPNVSFNQSTALKELKREISNFIDFEVEQPLLDKFLNPNTETFQMFYNEKTIGSFTKGNSFGGSLKSGSPNQPLMYENYAWESVSAAAKSLGKDRKTIRNRKDLGVFIEISVNDFNSFQGNKIQNSEAETYFSDKVQELQVLKQKLKFK